MSMITIQNLSTSYGKKRVLNNLSFQAEPGEILGILGENGSGKSTLIKSICNILPHEGSCVCADGQLEKMSSKQLAGYCSYVPQKSGLEIDMTVLEVVLMGFNPKLPLLANPSKAMVERAKQQLNSIGFQDKIEADFMSLSEGQKQMCILMRAMVSDSSLLLMDEPENALDVRMRYRMMSMIKKWVSQDEKTAIVALHDIELALNYCDRLLLIKDGKNAGIFVPKTDSISDLEEALTEIYGRLCLRKVADSAGKEHLVMIKEEEL